MARKRQTFTRRKLHRLAVARRREERDRERQGAAEQRRWARSRHRVDAALKGCADA